MRPHTLFAIVVIAALTAAGIVVVFRLCDASPRPVCYSVLHGGQSRAPAAAQQSLGRGRA